MDNELDDYIHEHLQKYVKYHLERGYTPLSLKKALTIFGYPAKDVDKIIKNTKIVEHKIDKGYSEKDLKGETYYYFRGALADYVKNQRNHGFEVKDIKNALIKYGHPKFLIEDAVGMTKMKKFKINHTTIFTISIIFILLFITAMSLTLETTFMAVFLVMSPALITIIIADSVTSYVYRRKEIVPLISVGIVIALFMFIFPALENIQADSAVLLVLNAVITFFATYFYAALYTHRKK